MLSGLEQELKAVKKAREALGDQAPSFGRAWDRGGDDRRHGDGVLGKRRRRGSDTSTGEEDIPDDVRRIPMPRDTPPPIPKDVMDKWYAKRRARREAENAARQKDTKEGEEAKKSETPAVESKTVYSAEPVRRDLRKEAVSAFVPTSVQMKMAKGKGQGGLMEPEEADKLEREGYLKTRAPGGSSSPVAAHADGEHAPPPPRTVTMEEVIEDDEG